jgi:hypothetical protein
LIKRPEEFYDKIMKMMVIKSLIMKMNHSIKGLIKHLKSFYDKVPKNDNDDDKIILMLINHPNKRLINHPENSCDGIISADDDDDDRIILTMMMNHSDK